MDFAAFYPGALEADEIGVLVVLEELHLACNLGSRQSR